MSSPASSADLVSSTPCTVEQPSSPATPSPDSSNAPADATPESPYAMPAPALVDPAESLSCTLCLSLFHDPVTVGCGHTFCRHCLLQAVAAKPSCPLCRAEITTHVETAAPNQVCPDHTFIDAPSNDVTTNNKSLTCAHFNIFSLLLAFSFYDSPSLPLLLPRPSRR